jgi:hypothetical protein
MESAEARAKSSSLSSSFLAVVFIVAFLGQRRRRR